MKQKEAKMAATLPNTRLYTRLERLVEQRRQAPTSRIPQAWGSGHESKAAYRLWG
jgi:hypothetical protein